MKISLKHIILYKKISYFYDNEIKYFNMFVAIKLGDNPSPRRGRPTLGRVSVWSRRNGR